MPSPFPGMNPYLEHPAVWPDFHNSFMYALRDQLAPQIAPNYVARGEAQLYIHELPEGNRYLLGRGDVGVSATGPPAGGVAAPAQAPVQGTLPAVDFERVQYLEIRDRLNREVITVIEVLSPANKDPGPDRVQYLAKRAQLLVSRVNLVEIDLLRGGPRMPVTGLPACDYCVIACRADEWPAAGIWPVRLRERLPVVTVPLRTREEHATLDLQAALDRVYDGGYYEIDIYQQPPQPALSPEDAAWAQAIASAARRPPA
jgi:hypothetical protein